MALLDDIAGGAAPLVSNVLRPGIKALMRTGITLYRSTVEPVSAAIGDLVSEAQIELATAAAARTAEPAPAPDAPPHKSRHRKHRGAGHQA